MTVIDHVNEITLVGRLSGEPEWRTLPSGGDLAVWRLVVDHRDARSPQDAIDTIRCVAFDERLHEAVRDWHHGDIIEVRGALRHRFWRGPASPRGIYEIEAETVILRARATPPEDGHRTRRARSAPADAPVSRPDDGGSVVVPAGERTTPGEERT
jgi:single-stranded DNA-binding protein